MEANDTNNINPNVVTPTQVNNNRFVVLEEREEEGHIAALEIAIERNRVAQRIIQQSPIQAVLNTTRVAAEAAYESAFGTGGEENTSHDSTPEPEENITGVEEDNGEEGNSNNDNTNPEEPKIPEDISISSEGSDFTTMSSSKSETAEELAAAILTRMEQLYPGITTPTKKKDYATIMRYRNLYGDATGEYECAGLEGGFAFLSDAEETYRSRVGDKTATRPDMPSNPGLRPTDGNKTKLAKWKADTPHYKECAKFKKVGIQLLEKKFPGCLTGLKNECGLPASVTLRNCCDHVSQSVNTAVSKSEAYDRLRKQFESMVYKHDPDDSECFARYLMQIGYVREDVACLKIDGLGMTAAELILRVQTSLRNGIQNKQEIKKLNKAW